MKKMLTFYRRTTERSRGQALVVIAVSFVALLLFIGLAIDGGMVLVNYGNLRRSVDAASLAAASQIRESTTPTDIQNVAYSTMQLNGVVASTVLVRTCDNDPDDTSLTPQSFTDGCTAAIPRKLVYVEGEIESPLAFMQLIGFSAVPLRAWAVSEAAVLDVIMVIDVSDSMAGRTSDSDTAYYATSHPDGTEATGNWSENPAFCNTFPFPPEPPAAQNDASEIRGGDAGNWHCMPFYDVKDAAIGFAQNVLDKNYDDDTADDEDRMAIATFAVGYDDNFTRIHQIGGAPFSSDYSDVRDTIAGLSVFEGSGVCNHTSTSIPPHIGKCRVEANPDFGYQCAPAFAGPDMPLQYDNGLAFPIDAKYFKDLSTCGTTSIGSGLLLAANLLGISSGERPNAVRVVILLTDGANNASAPKGGDCSPDCDPDDLHTLMNTDPKIDNYFGHCPEGPPYYVCRDNDVLTRHVVDLSGSNPLCPMWLRVAPGDPFPTNPECPSTYDADDFAMDVAEVVGCPSIVAGGSNCRTPGQGAVIFTIGMGSQVSSSQFDDFGRPFGAYMLRFIAEVGEDGNPLGTTVANCTGDNCVVNYNSGEDSCAGLYGSVTDLETNCGNYYFAEGAQDLPPVFEAIAARIFTRIAQ